MEQALNRRRRRWTGSRVLLTAGAGVAAALNAAMVGVGWVGSERAIHPQRIQEAHDLPEYPFAPAAEDVRFPSLDGTPLAGWFVPGAPDRAPTVVLLHGYGNSRPQLLPHAAYLHRAGYHTLLIDFRNRGRSGGDAVTVGAMEPLDVRGAVSYLCGRPDVDPSRIAVQGVSLGAAAGILAAANDPRIAAVVAESAFADLAGAIRRSFEYFIGLPAFPFAPVTVAIVELRLGARAVHVRPVEAIRRLHRPAFIIDDLADDLVPPRSGERLYEAAPGPKELWRVPHAPHTGGLDTCPDEYQRRVLDFYARYLTPAPARPA